MTELVVLIGLLVAALVFSTLIAGQARRLLLPSGSEWLVAGFALGPAGFDLIGTKHLLALKPVIGFGIAWLGLLLGMYFTPAPGTAAPRGTRVVAPLVVIATALSTFVLLRLGLTIAMDWSTMTLSSDPDSLALVLTVCGTAGSRLALRWLRQLVGHEGQPGPRICVLMTIAQWDNLVAILGIAALHWLTLAGIGLSVAWLDIAVSLLVGLLLGVLAAILLGHGFDRVSAWGTLLGAALLAAGIATRLGQPPVAALFVLGITVARLSPIREHLRSMLAVTEGPTLIVVLTAAGAAVELHELMLAPLTIALFLVVRAAARGLGGLPLWALPERRTAGLGLASLALGPFSVALALHLWLVAPESAHFQLVLAVVVVGMVLSELYAPWAMRRLLTRAGELLSPRDTSEAEPSSAQSTEASHPDIQKPGPDTNAASALHLSAEASEEHGIPPSWTQTAIRLVALASLYAMAYLVVQLSPAATGHGPAVAGLGLLILGGTLGGQILEKLRLPRVTGYLLAGLAAGPHGLVLVQRATVGDLGIVNGLALGLLALEAGGELSISLIKRDFRNLLYGTLAQLLVVSAALTVVIVAIAGWIPFLADMDLKGVIAVGLLWSLVAVSMSPAAALAVLTETGARGPVSRVSLGIIVVVEVLILGLFALALPVAHALLEPSKGFAVHELGVVAHELLGSVALGTTLGLLIGLSMLVIRKQRLLLFVVLAFFGYEFSSYLGFDAMIVFLAAGFTVRNVTPLGPAMLTTLERSAVIMVIFFANSGANLDVPAIVGLWPVVATLAGARMIAMGSAGWAGARMAGAAKPLQRWVWTGFVPQGALALAMALMVTRSFPKFGEAFYSLVLAVLGLNLLFGPILYKIGLARAGETKD